MRQYQDLERPYCFIGKEPLTPDEIGDGWDCCQDCINERLEKITIKEREDEFKQSNTIVKPCD